MQSELTLKQQVVSGLRWSAGLRFIGQLLTWAITILVMRILSPQDYGLLGMAGVFLSYLATINELGLGAAIVQGKRLKQETLRQIFGMLLAVNCAIFLLCFFLAPVISSFFNEVRLIPFIRFLAIQFLITSFVIIPQSLVNREMLFKQKSVVELVSAIAGSLTTFVLALNGYGVWSLLWGSLTLSLFGMVGLNLIKPCFFLPKFSLKGMGRFFSFGSYVAVSNIIWTFYSQADVVIVGKLLGQRLLGLYSVALNLASLPMEKISGIINQVAFPAFASVQSDIQASSSHFLKAVRLMSLTAFPVLWGISSVAGDFVYILLGDKWVDVIVPLQILSLVIPIRMISNLMSPMLLGLGRPNIQLFNTIVYSTVLPISFLLGSYWGIVGVSVAWVTIFPLVFLFNMSRATRVLKISLRNVIAQMTGPLLSVIVMYLTVLAIRAGLTDIAAIIRIVLCILGGALVYSALIMIFLRDGYQEVLALIRT